MFLSNFFINFCEDRALLAEAARTRCAEAQGALESQHARERLGSTQAQCVETRLENGEEPPKRPPPPAPSNRSPPATFKSAKATRGDLLEGPSR